MKNVSKLLDRAVGPAPLARFARSLFAALRIAAATPLVLAPAALPIVTALSANPLWMLVALVMSFVAARCTSWEGHEELPLHTLYSTAVVLSALAGAYLSILLLAGGDGSVVALAVEIGVLVGCLWPVVARLTGLALLGKAVER